MSAIRQYSGFDYFITFLSFLMYSLPVFWVAVLLKQYGAIEFNNFLGDPVVGWGTIITVSVVSGLIWMGALGGSSRRRIYVLIGATVVTLTSSTSSSPPAGSTASRSASSVSASPVSRRPWS